MTTEWVFYLPLMFLGVLAVTQVCSYALADRATSAATREVARYIRQHGSTADSVSEARKVGLQYLTDHGGALVSSPEVRVTQSPQMENQFVLVEVTAIARSAGTGVPVPVLRIRHQIYTRVLEYCGRVATGSSSLPMLQPNSGGCA